jgi:hypothetical protein
MTRIAARVVVLTARETAARGPRVRVALSRLPAADTRSNPEAEAGMTGESTATKLTLAAELRPGSASTVRADPQRGHQWVRALTGLDPVAVSVAIHHILS